MQGPRESVIHDFDPQMPPKVVPPCRGGGGHGVLVLVTMFVRRRLTQNQQAPTSTMFVRRRLNTESASSNLGRRDRALYDPSFRQRQIDNHSCHDSSPTQPRSRKGRPYSQIVSLLPAAAASRANVPRTAII